MHYEQGLTHRETAEALDISIGTVKSRHHYGLQWLRKELRLHHRAETAAFAGRPCSSMLTEPFQRLHGRAEYAGTGIGLAITERIVHRHGGSISAQGVAGEGTIITIRLPVGAAHRRRSSVTQGA